MASEVRCMIQQQLITNKVIITSIIPKFRPLSPSYGSGKAPPKTCALPICCSHSHSHFGQPHHQRRSAHYQPTIWSYEFVQSLNIYDHVETYEDEVKKLEEEVKCILTIKNNELDGHDALLLNKLELVDEIQRLGLGYRFKEDIKEVIDGIFFNIWDDQGFDNATTEKSLRTAALGFRLLRHHGYQVSQDIFKSFKDDNGDFQECICKDVKGMLSLYEASFLAFEGENLLDEAKAFTSMHLQNLIRQNANTSLAEEVNHALELPLHQRMQRLEARWYIESYSKRLDVNQLLLQLAKLDFNMAQSTLQKELKDMSRWWKGLGLANKLSFSRDRLMECFFWALGMVNEPQFSNTRKELTKVAALITVIDDVYDVYGTLDELELFTNAVERWNVNIAVTVLPDYMKLCFLALYNTVNEMVYETLKEQGQNSLSNLTKAWADMCKAFLVEAKWSRSKYTPTFEEYIENGWISVSGVLLLVHAYFLVSENISNHGVDCLEDHHNLLRWPSIIFRLSNDLGTSAAEIQRGETANSISCSMRQNHHSEESARKCLHGLMEESWKKMNMEIADVDSPFTKPFLDTAINLARISRCTYQYGDGHGAPDTRSKNRVLSLIIDPIQ